jgi:hypothetical protein
VAAYRIHYVRKLFPQDMRDCDLPGFSRYLPKRHVLRSLTEEGNVTMNVANAQHLKMVRILKYYCYLTSSK